MNGFRDKKKCGLVVNIQLLMPYPISIRVRLRVQNRTFDGRSVCASLWLDTDSRSMGVGLGYIVLELSLMWNLAYTDDTHSVGINVCEIAYN